MNSKSQSVYIVIIVLLLLAVVGVYYHYHQKVSTLAAMVTQEASNKRPELGNRPGGTGSQSGMMMPQSSPPAVSDQQTAQLALGTDKTVTKKTFNITGGDFYFVPNNITVNKGDQVTLVMTNAGGMHNLVIDELSVNTPIIKSGQADSATFTASKVGSFVYYCAVPGHREKGMWGTLIIQ